MAGDGQQAGIDRAEAIKTFLYVTLPCFDC